MRKLSILLLLPVVMLASCQLSRITLPVYTPPRLVFPPDLRSFVVTSRYVPATGLYEDVQWGAYESVDSLKWLLAESVVDTLGKRMITDNNYLVKIRHKPRMLRHNDATAPDPLPWDGVLALAKKEFVQGVLVLEGFDLQKSPVQVTGGEGNYSSVLDITITLAVRAYEPDKMRLPDDSVYTFVSSFTGSGSTKEEALLNLPDERKAMFSACSAAADSYYRQICPGTQQEKRNYFSKGDTSLIKVHGYIRDGKWGKAESRWKWLAYNSPDTLVLAKASYNMALMCERDGRLNQAMGFARRSQNLHPDRRTAAYIGILEGRIREFETRVEKGEILKRW
jgi:hypothetical protein